MSSLNIQGIVRIKNVSGAQYVVEELGGHVLEDQAEVDLLDTTIPEFYDDWETARRLVSEVTTAKLYQDIQSGDIEVVGITPPIY